MLTLQRTRVGECSWLSLPLPYKKPSALCNFLLWLLTCWNCNASQFSNKLKGLCLFSLLLQASFWRLQIQFCGFLMLVCFFFFFKILLKAWDGGGALVLILVLPCQECCSLCAFPHRALSGTLEPQDHVEVLLLVLPEGSSQPGLWDRHLHPSSSAACSLGLMPSPSLRAGQGETGSSHLRHQHL